MNNFVFLHKAGCRRYERIDGGLLMQEKLPLSLWQGTGVRDLAKAMYEVCAWSVHEGASGWEHFSNAVSAEHEKRKKSLRWKVFTVGSTSLSYPLHYHSVKPGHSNTKHISNYLSKEEQVNFVPLVMSLLFLTFVARGAGAIFSLFVEIFLALDATRIVLSVFSVGAWEAYFFFFLKAIKATPSASRADMRAVAILYVYH